MSGSLDKALRELAMPQHHGPLLSGSMQSPSLAPFVRGGMGKQNSMVTLQEMVRGLVMEVPHDAFSLVLRLVVGAVCVASSALC